MQPAPALTQQLRDRLTHSPPISESQLQTEITVKFISLVSQTQVGYTRNQACGIKAL